MIYQICHRDLNAQNILLQQTEQGKKCWLIDFDKCGVKLGDFWNSRKSEPFKTFVRKSSWMNEYSIYRAQLG